MRSIVVLCLVVALSGCYMFESSDEQFKDINKAFVELGQAVDGYQEYVKIAEPPSTETFTYKGKVYNSIMFWTYEESMFIAIKEAVAAGMKASEAKKDE